MTFVFVPIPTTEAALGKTAPLWMPFLEKISHRKGSEPFASLVSQVSNFEVHIGMVWDETKAHGLIAWQLRQIGDDLVVDLVWMVGRDAKKWRHLISDLERYLKEQPAGPINPPPLLTGHDLTRHGLEPGPLFKRLLDAVREAQLEGTITTPKQATELVDRLLAEWNRTAH